MKFSILILVTIAFTFGCRTPQGESEIMGDEQMAKSKWAFNFKTLDPQSLPAKFPTVNVVCSDNKMSVIRTNDTVKTISACPKHVYFADASRVLAQFPNGLWHVDLKKNKENRLTADTPEKLFCLQKNGVFGRYTSGLWFQEFNGSERQITTGYAKVIYGCVQDGLVAQYGNGVWLQLQSGKESKLGGSRPKKIYGHNPTGVVGCYSNGLWHLGFKSGETKIAAECPDSILDIQDHFILGCYNGNQFIIDKNGAQRQLNEACAEG